MGKQSSSSKIKEKLWKDLLKAEGKLAEILSKINELLNFITEKLREYNYDLIELKSQNRPDEYKLFRKRAGQFAQDVAYFSDELNKVNEDYEIFLDIYFHLTNITNETCDIHDEYDRKMVNKHVKNLEISIDKIEKNKHYLLKTVNAFDTYKLFHKDLGIAADKASDSIKNFFALFDKTEKYFKKISYKWHNKIKNEI